MKNYCWMALALALACAPPMTTAGPDSGSETDSGTLPDAGRSDAGSAWDAGPTRDAGASDSGVVEPDGGPLSDAGADSGSPTDAGASTDAGLGWGTAISAPPDTWTWVPFPDSSCNDGSPVGIGINPSPTSSNVLIYFNGGGACWDAFTCLVVKSATLGPYTNTQFNSDLAAIGGVMDRTDTLNPFNDWNQVFVPYCTGDVHAGDNIATYVSGTQSIPFHHKGHANFMAYLARLGPTFLAPAKVAVAGDSAGGAGAVVNYASARAYWPDAKMYLVNDSLPFYPPSETPKATMSSELTNWGIQPLLQDICGSPCVADFSLIFPALRPRFPADRMAYMGYEQDNTMSAYYETLPALFQVYLGQLDSKAFQPAGINTYFLNGTSHTVLWSWATDETTQSVNLRVWMGQMIADDPAWTSAGP